MPDSSFSTTLIHHIAQLASLTLTADEEGKFADAFTQTIKVVAHMSELDTTKTEPTHQVTGLENVLREDEVDTQRTFTQAQALANAASQVNGYFKVKQIIDQD